MKELTLCAYAKINLHLEVTGKRDDGYHTVESLMQSVSLCDILTLRPRPSGIALTCSDKTLSCGEDNLILRAARAFLDAAEMRDGVSIHLIKRIPMQAGMGGGSSDAAAALRGMNLLFGSPLPESTLYDIAARLGADVPFCLRGKSALARGIGTELTDAPALPPCRIVIGMGSGDKMSTRDAYSALDALSYQPQDCAKLLSSLDSGDFCAICGGLFNRFTPLNPSAEVGMQRLRALGADGTLLCGSGAAFFGLFAPEKEGIAAKALEQLAHEGYRTWSAEPI